MVCVSKISSNQPPITASGGNNSKQRLKRPNQVSQMSLLVIQPEDIFFAMRQVVRVVHPFLIISGSEKVCIKTENANNSGPHNFL